MINRRIHKNILNRLKSGKATILLGPRQVGKTTILQEIIKQRKNALWLNADHSDVRNLFNQPSSVEFQKTFANSNLVVIDEAQQIDDIGRKLKLITDELKDIQLIVTGSSAFELANRLNEPLTGRKWELQMFPLSVEEMVDHHGILEEKRLLKHRLVYGFYPEVVTAKLEHKEILQQLSDSYLYKDILVWNKINKSEMLSKLLQALAFQLGNQVSYNELGNILGVDNETVESYIQLLEYSYIIFRLPSFSRNPRTELKKSRKIYFYDNGIRNAIIANFQAADLRADIGALWENFLVSERMKFNAYNKRWVNRFFWRTKAQQEVDYLEETDGKLYGFEFKWNTLKKARITKAFTNAYPDAITKIITPDNYLEFVSL